MADDHFPTRKTDKSSARGMVQDSVHRYTSLKRDEIRRRYFEENGEPIPEEQLDLVQPLVEEYDPLVELALIAVDRENDVTLRRQANADVAPYVRPKLSAVHVESLQAKTIEHQEKEELSSRLLHLMEAFEADKRGS